MSLKLCNIVSCPFVPFVLVHVGVVVFIYFSFQEFAVNSVVVVVVTGERKSKRKKEVLLRNKRNPSYMVPTGS